MTGDGREVSGAEPQVLLKLRLMTWNIHEGIGEDGRYDLNRLARVIRLAAPDLVALQEVGRRWSAASQYDDQLLRLSEELGYHPFFAPIVDEGTRQYGCGLLSRWAWRAVKDHGLIRIGTFDPEKRVRHLPGFPQGTVVPGGEAAQEQAPAVHLFGTHLYWRDAGIREREAEEMVAIMRPLLEAGELVLLAGDLNAERDDPELAPLARLTAAGILRDVGPQEATYPARDPQKRIDLVLAGPGWIVQEARVWPEPLASDHRPVVVDLLAVMAARSGERLPSRPA